MGDVAYETDRGVACVGDAIDVLLDRCEPDSVDLVMTSPPFALLRGKEYGNASQDSYVEWFQAFADVFWEILKPSGSLVIDLGGAWESGKPVKSLYAFELLIALCRRPRRTFHLAQDFYWYNPARLPTPAAWVTVERIRAKDAVNYVWWLSKSDRPKADNTKVVTEYTPAMKRLLESGTYNRGKRPSGHVVAEGFTNDRGGAIPPNLLAVSNTGNDASYASWCKERNLPLHPARFPAAIPEFFIGMLTDPDDLVVDPFAGSNVTGMVAEQLGRRWIACDTDAGYIEGSRGRFQDVQLRLAS